jgi:hypothetical protein
MGTELHVLPHWPSASVQSASLLHACMEGVTFTSVARAEPAPKSKRAQPNNTERVEHEFFISNFLNLSGQYRFPTRLPVKKFAN